MLRVANWMRLVFFVAHYCVFVGSIVCKDAVMGPDPDPAHVLESIEG